MPSVHLKGLKELSRQLETFNREIHKELKSALKAAVKVVAMDAKAAAPVDSGEYKKSIKHSVSSGGLVGYAFAERRKMNDDPTKVSNRGYVGHLLEYGTVKDKAQPHFGPAMDKAKGSFGKRLEDAIRRVKGLRGQT